jgi:serine/threonine protein kinase
MRTLGRMTKELRNEVRAVEKLCQPGVCCNVVSIYNHGRLQADSLHYFLDLELCDFNLEQYISGKWTPALQPRVHNLTDCVKPDVKMAQIWKIMEDILGGLVFIHFKSEVHRDLKPRNGLFYLNFP